ncbi:hypothetical protein SAY87_003283 [Trapa incisa]|uniref:Kinesin-like protein n=1 Tax=Trapa incisa TaxID=236973 RepID=A0AAN7KSA1_9MYRT|nr:hypothetical protein SAY87_003283 [Trapa incisa]
MPVSTRSQASGQKQDDSALHPRSRIKTHQEKAEVTNFLTRNPHYGLKEKMRELTLLYEQQKQARNSNFSSYCSSRTEDQLPRLKDNPKDSGSIDMSAGGGQVIRRNTMTHLTATRTFVFPKPRVQHKFDDLKENLEAGQEKAIGLFCYPPQKADPATVARRLSTGVGRALTENLQETEKLEAADERSVPDESRILVFVRLRPMGKKEKEVGSRCCVRIVNRKDVYLTEFANENDYLRLKRLRGRHFTFDASFSDTTTQQEVYSTTTADLVESVLQGKNGSVFCYGATGAGKTYTMLGTVGNPGVMVLAIKDLFTKVRQRSCDGNHAVHLSYLEVYNETVKDLLSPGRPLVLREDKQGMVAAGLTQYRAYSPDEVMALLLQGNQNRTTEPTRANETSSRSHAILQVVVEYRVRDSAMNVINRVGKLSLIDLAGSERALATDQRTLRSIEGANINRSLLALSSCINALVEAKKHIPYRNSKLTQLLKDSLGGSCNTVMIANISPSNLLFSETQNTLHWADRAKQIRTKASNANEQITQVPEGHADQVKLLLELQKENRELRAQLAQQQQKLVTLQAQYLAAQSSPTPSSVTSLLTPPTTTGVPSKKRKARPSFLSGTCFTPELKRKGTQEATAKELLQTVNALEGEIEKMKRDHSLKLKQKDDYIKELIKKGEKPQTKFGTEGARRMITRSSLRPKQPSPVELKSPSHLFRSPVPTAKKRSFGDITTGNSPSIISGRKMRSHAVSVYAAAAPSMLLQV